MVDLFLVDGGQMDVWKMRNLQYLIIVSFLCAGAGCAHVPFMHRQAKSEDVSRDVFEGPKQNFAKVDSISDGKIVDRFKLRQGGKLVVVPFYPGNGVVADQETEKASLMIIKGIADAFADGQVSGKANFEILTADKADEADFVLQGQITQMLTPSKVKRWLFLRKARKLSVEGKMTDAADQKVIVFFNDSDRSAQSGSDEENFKTLGYQIGKKIGQFILSGARD